MEELYDTKESTDAENEDARSEAAEDTPSDNQPDCAPDTKDVDEPIEKDYEAIIASDIETLRSEFPELRGISDITDLNNPLRYAALRDLGLSPEEAYMATAKRKSQDTRSHLRSAHGRNAAATMGMMSQYELATARELFPGMSDSELQRLYKKVTK